MSLEVKGRIRYAHWSVLRPDVVELRVLVSSADLDHCPAPLPDDVTLVIPEPIPAPPISTDAFTITVTKDLLEKCQPELRTILLAMGPNKE